jgi:[CysO sulfur-carrier protein]-S-L-cysteine hydrolase
MVSLGMKITNGVMEQILIHTVKDAPVEACGVLLGSGSFITRCIPLANMEQREDHFTCDPHDQFEAMKIAEESGVEIIGAYHSHPATPPRPSEEDIRLAYDPKLLYVIASLADNKRQVKAFWIRKGEVEEEPLHIED